ncbi:hypothetical protein PUN28_003920 [Cardiocondyla obscurior]|uniref:Prisilkin-39 n=1 Tax=Cardiocondyla obscurior TaxID=286306 RepID=A0AAW2GLH0_9HYME
MKLFFVISTFALIAICRGADESPDELKLLTKLTPVSSEQRVFSESTRDQGDLDASASDRTFHITKGYPGGYPGSIGGYPGGYPYGTGVIGSVYPGTSYRGGSLIPGYRGQYIPGGGNLGYGYYGNVGSYPGYSGYSGYGGYGGYGGGLGGIGGSYGGYDDGNLGYGRGGYGRYDGYDTYGYGNTYGTNYGTTYAARSPYAPYSYRSDTYGTSLSTPTGYRGYS